MKFKLILIIISCIFSLKAMGQVATYDATTFAAVKSGNAFLASTKALAEKSFSSLTDLKKSGLDLLQITKQYQDALSAVNSFVRNSDQAKDIFAAQKQIIAMYTNNTYKYDRYFNDKYREMVHSAMKNGLNKSVKVMSKTNVILSENFVKMNDNERFQQLDQISKEMMKISYGMRSFIDVFSRYAEARRQNPNFEEINLNQ
ncbi:hypothetical protein [Pedobacter jeongneungensis]|uniref:hypothetical protein n=1 Tax=Pedobacter jeongneungensis TaxID=947309 RepID=UPI000467FC6B|nr:hypothetical protein [Pedobacter jeongneungensis]